LGSVSSLVSEKKIFEISANQSILFQGTFLLSLVPIGPVVSEKKLEM
jgi:hypothetical protein